MKIEITDKDSEVITREVQTRRGPMTFHEQYGYAHLPGRQYPERIKITLERDRQGKGYAPGSYSLDPSSFWVDKFKGLNCSPRLVPAK